MGMWQRAYFPRSHSTHYTQLCCTASEHTLPHYHSHGSDIDSLPQFIIIVHTDEGVQIHAYTVRRTAYEFSHTPMYQSLCVFGGRFECECVSSKFTYSLSFECMHTFFVENMRGKYVQSMAHGKQIASHDGWVRIFYFSVDGSHFADVGRDCLRLHHMPIFYFVSFPFWLTIKSFGSYFVTIFLFFFVCLPSDMQYTNGTYA